ncbi:hypothetical protein R5R35_014030 [Gryllus longicercus]|uniref:U3 small nucleolar RNA-associated protein 6 homolog n=1 Tax=Gryllus longicercus TaxID=2509291 RepID=A0AAN9VWS2_9ORTH
MAEFVDFRSEEMVPELEQLERLRIFNETEIRNIIKQRKNFQHKIQTRTKNKEDYVRYIHYEIDLLKLVKSRKQKLGLSQKKNDIDMTIASRVNKLYEKAIFKYHDDIYIWLSYMKFCKQVKVFSVCVSNMLLGMLAAHSHKPSLWKLAATWEYEDNKNIETACQFLVRGLRQHPRSKVLHTAAFQMELIYADMKRKQVESRGSEDKQEGKQAASATSSSTPVTVSAGPPDQGDSSMGPLTHSLQVRALQWQEAMHEPSLSSHTLRCDDPSDLSSFCGIAEFIYEAAAKKIPDVPFLIGLLNIAKDYSFTEKLQAKMVKDLLSWFPNDELTWDALARRELEGLHFFMDRTSSTDEESMEVCEENDTKPQKSETEKIQYMRIRHCITIYQSGLQHLGTERMWGLYLDTLIELNQDVSVLKKYKQNLLLSALQKAHEEGRLQEKYYIHWAGMHTGQREQLSFVLDAATERFSSSIELWQMRLSFHLSEDEEDVAMAVFKHAVACLSSDDDTSLPLWKMLIQYFQTKNVNKVKEVFEDGIKQGPAVASPLKLMYLEWLVLAKDISTARQVYQSICDKAPFCRELHQKMATLECLQPEVQISRVVKCYELACEQFGKDSTEVWMEYVKFERIRGDPKKVKEIYLRALKSLDKQLAHRFISEFCQFWVNVMIKW